MDLLDSLLGIPKKLDCKPDTRTTITIIGRRTYGGYSSYKSPVVTISDSLMIHTGKTEYEEMINDMTRMSLNRSKGLMAEKRTSRYEKAMKSGHKK